MELLSFFTSLIISLQIHGQFVETQGVNDGVNHDLNLGYGEFELYMVNKHHS